MLVGPSLAGKSTVWKTLSAAMGRLKKDGVRNPEGTPFEAVRPIVINPKAVPYANLYGEYDQTRAPPSKPEHPLPNPSTQPSKPERV